MKKPYAKVHIEITNVCNLKCSFCPEVQRDNRFIEVSLFSKIASQLTPLTDQVALHLMGEPLLHPQLAELVDICAANNLKINLVSNGVLLREKQRELLLHPAFRQVNFSLHSFFDNFKDRDPKEYLERIFHFTEQAFLRRPDLYLNYRLWNLKEVRGGQGMNGEMLKRISERFHNSTPIVINLRQQKSFHIVNRLYLHFDSEFIWPSLDLPVLGTQGRCYGLSSHFGILVDGTVVPCCLDKEAAISLGRVQDEPIVAILNSDRAQKILAGFRQQRLTEDLCQRCQYIERFQKPQPQALKTLAKTS